MHTARPAGFRPAAQAQFCEQALYFEGHAAYIIPTHARNRVEIDPQFVRMVKITRPHRMRMQLDTSEIDDPCQAGWVVDDYFLGCAARRKRQCDGSQPRRSLFRRTLLIK